MDNATKTKMRRRASILAGLCCAVSASVAQIHQETRTVIVNGHTGDASITEIQGRTFVDLAALARIGNGSVSFQGTQIILSLGSSGDNGASPGTKFGGAADSGISRVFVNAALEEIGLLREWVSPLANAIQNGYPVTDSWVASYRAKAATGLAAATAAISSSADQNSFELLKNEFDAVQQWSNKLLEARKSMSAANYTLSADSLRNDPLSQKILACGRFLAPMLATGSYQDDASCH